MQPVASSALTEEEITHLLAGQSTDVHQPPFAAALSNPRPAAVLIPILREGDEWSLLFTRRTETVQSHKGQVSFPGGAADLEDIGPEATALREAYEEIGLLPEDVKILGRLAPRPTISDFLITPVVGSIRWPNQFRLSQEEVSRLFTVPLAWLADPTHWEERPRTVLGQYIEPVVYYQNYEGEIVWGITARIMLDFLHALQLL